MSLDVFAMFGDCLSEWSSFQFVFRRRFKGLVLPLFSLFFIFLLVFSSFVTVFSGSFLDDALSLWVWIFGVVGAVLLLVVVGWLLLRRKG